MSSAEERPEASDADPSTSEAEAAAGQADAQDAGADNGKAAKGKDVKGKADNGKGAKGASKGKDKPPQRPAVFCKVDALRPDSAGVHVTVKVLAAKVVVDRARPDGSQHRIAESVVGDDSGVIVFTARGKQVDQLKEGAALHLRNAKVDMFKGSMRLVVDKWGVVEKAEGDDAKLKVNEDNNLSAIHYELVAVNGR